MIETFAGKDNLRAAAFEEAAAFQLPEDWQQGRAAALQALASNHFSNNN